MSVNDSDRTDGATASEPPVPSGGATAAGRRRIVWYAVAAVAAVAAIVAGALLTARDDAPQTSERTGTPSMSNGSATTSTAAPSKPTSRPLESKTATGPHGLKSPTQSRPTRPAESGARLATITTPPDKTLAMLAADSIDESARYAITFRPYGKARLSSAGLVINIVTSTPLNDEAKDRSFANRNVFAAFGDKEATDIALGGTYRAELGFRKSGESLLLVLYGIELQK